ncbi:MAG: hypothetical protein PUB08_05815 [Firmicutes bacterium]|nr:hypothetical protein [Bacillota bacterium]
MFDKKTLDEWQKDIQGKSGLEAPVLGYIQCPLCKVCKNFGEQRGSWYNPKCSIYGNPPDKYKYGSAYDCPNFVKDEKSQFLYDFTFDENGKATPKHK